MTSKNHLIKNILKDIYPFPYSVVSGGNDESINHFKKYLNFNVLEYESGAEVNGWIVPNMWKLISGSISDSSGLNIDLAQNPFMLAVLSPSYSGKVSNEVLKKHAFYSENCPNAYPYLWQNLYRPGNKDWYVSLTKEMYEKLNSSEYDVEIKTAESVGTMKVLDYLLPGELPDTFLINAHNCHPFQANDDTSGCAVGISLFMKLAKLKKRKYTYRLIIAPELIGTVHWLNSLSDLEVSHLKGAILLKSVGNDAPIKLQLSFNANSRLDEVAKNVIKNHFLEPTIGGFREVYGNDETVFDSPGYEIPTISITRFPFDEYHTSFDTPEMVSEDKLLAVRNAVFEMIMCLERDKRMIFVKKGLVSLSNPAYNLYKSAVAPGIDKERYLEEQRRWNLLMNCLPRLLDGNNSAISIANKFKIPAIEVIDYLDLWLDKGLAREYEYEG